MLANTPNFVETAVCAFVGGKNVFAANQKALRATHDHAIAIGLPTAAVVIRTSAS